MSRPGERTVWTRPARSRPRGAAAALTDFGSPGHGCREVPEGRSLAAQEREKRSLHWSARGAVLVAQGYLPIIALALSGVIAVVATVTTVGTLSAQSSRIDFAMSIASGPPVG